MFFPLEIGLWGEAFHTRSVNLVVWSAFMLHVFLSSVLPLIIIWKMPCPSPCVCVSAGYGGCALWFCLHSLSQGQGPWGGQQNIMSLKYLFLFQEPCQVKGTTWAGLDQSVQISTVLEEWLSCILGKGQTSVICRKCFLACTPWQLLLGMLIIQGKSKQRK